MRPGVASVACALQHGRVRVCVVGCHRGKDVTLKLYWEVMPLAGMLVQSQLGAARFSMPDAYVALKRD